MARGGFRVGAGRPGWRLKAEDAFRLSVDRLNDAGALAPGCLGTWHWSTATGMKGEINYRTASGALVLEFRANGIPSMQRVPLYKVPTSGCAQGLRTWFGCPLCFRRASKLYLGCSGFACRQCAGIAYQSQSETPIERAVVAQVKAEAALGPGGARPRCMRRATYARLQEEVQRRDVERKAELRRVLCAALGWEG
jgi:hypothetical protein